MAGLVGGLFNSILGGSKEDYGRNMVVYKGTIVVMKKILMLDLMDRAADLQDDASELLGKHISVQLVGNEVDPKTKRATMSHPRIIEGWVTKLDTLATQNYTFKMEFPVPRGFGEPGAILVKNNHPNEFLLVSFSLSLPDLTEVHYMTNSWVYNTGDTEGRIFFQNKPYLPHETPASLREFRTKELRALQGDGTGVRQFSDRVYDYDVYNDLANPDDDLSLERPNLGNSLEYPYPRRCRTGRPPAQTNSLYESMPKADVLGNLEFYVPRDEAFERTKMSDFKADNIRSKGHGLTSKLSVRYTQQMDFDSIESIKKLYAPKNADLGGLNNVLPDKKDVAKQYQSPFVFLQELMTPDGEKNTPLQYPLPGILQADDNAWQTNEEFAREFLAGLNPIVIQLVKQFPLRSRLDPKRFGDPTSAITAQHIEKNLEGLSIDKAVSEKKLFVADYHDSYLPFVERINSQKDSKTYATRALFFLSANDQLKVLALELVLPPMAGKPKLSLVFTPPNDTSKDFIWQTARAHVANNDIVVHQVFSHWTKCHAATEPVIIATNRQLSKLHPINHLMAPHLRSTLYINQGARAKLIAAGGTIESTFTPRAYGMRMAAVNYKDTWTFESQALPNDLIARGMAVPDPKEKHGVKLVVQDYPYAADGLELWAALKAWNAEYVDVYYKDDAAVLNDVELQNWWWEIRNVGHADKRNAKWPEANTKSSLVEILTTIQWIPSCQHAAVNFGQYAYAGFMPHHPTLTRRLFPAEGSPEWDDMKKNAEKFYLSAISDVNSATRTMSVYEVLSSHSADEKYIGERGLIEDKRVTAALKRFTAKLDDIDGLIKKRNTDPTLKNRLGVAKLPYELLRPTSKPGVTAMGIPNSITI
ncbi:hypothetical protein KC19_11G118900 [Ceratodon purpureus]|uniref:Lipoxygenase n=2 Tax=Ceratodon purpureus TaxID=3225 RepID=A0A8T0GHR7_CERPU|nr:hypothetical protein KC19_11G118900 [Ceratodon purpureus]